MQPAAQLGVTPLMSAAQLGRADVVAELIRRRADVNTRVKVGTPKPLSDALTTATAAARQNGTALYQAALGDHARCVALLLEARADATVTTHWVSERSSPWSVEAMLV